MRHGPFRAYFTTGLLSMMGDNVEHVISYWVIFQAFHSPTLAGFAVISHWTPFLVLGVWFGGLADRFDCRKIIVASQLAFIAASLAWALLFLTGTLQTWHAVVLLIVHGLAGALWSPAGQLIIHDIVGHEQLQSGVRLAATGRSVGILFGPAVGGALLLGLGPAYGLMANALLYLPMTIWLLRTPYTGHSRTVASDESARLSLADALRTLREISGNRGILVMTALAGLSSLLVGGVLNIGFTSMAQAYVQLEAPPARRGRVVGLFSMSWNGLRVGSGVTVGILGAAIGIHYSLALSAIAFLVAGVALFVYANGRARQAVTA